MVKVVRAQSGALTHKLVQEKPVKLKNLNGTSDNQCKCQSWLAHWLKFSRKTISLCPVVSCFDRAEVGAHVQKDTNADNNWYIVPLCKKHNAEKSKTIEVSDDTSLVPANVSNTCGGH